MTDNEIIKALECCYEDISTDCDSCPNKKTCADISVINSVLDLIKRQKTEVERLNAKILAKDNTNDYNTAQLRIAREKLRNLEQENIVLSRNADTAFQDVLNEAQDLYAEQVRQEIKSEAIKEFAERLKSEYEDETQGRYMNWLMNDIIDNLVKEMTEVEK